MTWRSAGSLLLCPSTTVSLLCLWMEILIQSPATLAMPTVVWVVFSVDGLIMSLSKPPLAAAVDHIAPHRLFRQVIKIKKDNHFHELYFVNLIYFMHWNVFLQHPAPLRTWPQWQAVAQTLSWPPGTPLLVLHPTQRQWQAPMASLKTAPLQTSHVRSLVCSVPVNTTSQWHPRTATAPALRVKLLWRQVVFSFFFASHFSQKPFLDLEHIMWHLFYLYLFHQDHVTLSMWPASFSVVQTWPQCPGKPLPGPRPTLCSLKRAALSIILPVGAAQLPVSWIICSVEKFTTLLWWLRMPPVTALAASVQSWWQVEERKTGQT